MRKLIQITESYSVLEGSASALDIYMRFVRRGLRGRPRRFRPSMTKVERAEALLESRKRRYALEKQLRLERIEQGVCTRCGKDPPREGSRMCDSCQNKGRKYVKKNYDNRNL